MLCIIAMLGCNLGVTTAEEPDEPVSKSPVLLAHYMPWFIANPEQKEWGWHWTMQKFDPNLQKDGKRQLASAYYPTIGTYDSGDSEVLEYHLLSMKLAGIDGVIVDWYGLTDFRDYAILHTNTTRLLQQCERLDMKFVICYEDQTVPALVQGGRLPESKRVEHVADEIQWLSKYWFQSAAYLKYQNKPVLLSFGHSGLTDPEWTQCLSQLKTPVAYFSQDRQREGAAGGFGWPAPPDGLEQVEWFHRESKRWSSAIPVVFPRFDDYYLEAGISQGYAVLPDRDGQTLKWTLKQALESKAAIIQIATWNDWGEGTQIEPSREFGFRDLQILQASQRETGHWKDKPAPTTDDLGLPLKIYQQRKDTGLTSSRRGQLDAAVKALSNGDYVEARKLIQPSTSKNQ